MKKRSMLAFASLATGVVLSLTAPQSHAVVPDGGHHDTVGDSAQDQHPVVEEPSGETTQH